MFQELQFIILLFTFLLLSPFKFSMDKMKQDQTLGQPNQLAIFPTPSLLYVGFL